VALSRISGYRMGDWLRVFDYSLEDITRLQVLLPSKRTIVLDTSLTDPDEWVSWFDDRPDEAAIPPLAKVLKVVPARRIGSENHRACDSPLDGSMSRLGSSSMDSLRKVFQRTY
jgi:hypothetical protein